MGWIREECGGAVWLSDPGALNIDEYYGFLLECMGGAWCVVGVHAVECDEELYSS